MNSMPNLTRYPIALVIALFLAFLSAACATALPLSTPTPVPKAAEVTPQATRVVTTEGSRVPEVPGTDTPVPASTPTQEVSPTSTPTLSPIIASYPSLTPTVAPPHVTILADTPCMYGPGTDYLLKYGLFALSWMRAVGRNPDGTWLNVKSLNDPLWNACWIKTEQVRFDNGSVRDVPIVWMTYPYSILYQPPTAVSATRTGNVVTIFWQPVYMTEDDTRGYLVEAWVCQGGRQVFRPIGYPTSFNRNNSTTVMSLQVTDEPGCDVPSNARIYAVEKHGYTGYYEIPWPAVEPAQTSMDSPQSTFTPSYTPTITPTPGLPPTPALPVVTLLEYSDCLYGPAAFFLYKTSLPAAAIMEVTGRSPDGSWIAVEEVHGWDSCWIPTAQVRFNTGSVEVVPVTYPTLPQSFWYKPPNPTAHRDGTEVTVSWKAVGMAEYDYHGYLIIAWVCQGGEHVYLPVSIVPAYAENTATLSVTIKDEPGCSQASSARIYTAEKRGYSGEMIFWPAY
jgi:hypothetical protein